LAEWLKATGRIRKETKEERQEVSGPDLKTDTIDTEKLTLQGHIKAAPTDWFQLNFKIIDEALEETDPNNASEKRDKTIIETSLRSDFPHFLRSYQTLDFKKVNEFEKKPLKDKWEYWEKQFDKCIRCYACRNACPLCYCKECMVDQLNPQWVRRSVNLSENTAWNLLRAFHLAGRCIGCGQCERACPMDMPLMELNKKIEKEIREMFEYEAGVNAEEKPLLAMFKPDDPEEFIL